VGLLLLVAGLLGLVLVLLAVPVSVEFRVEGILPFRGQVGVRWLFGLVRVRLPLHRAGPGKAREPRSAIRRERPEDPGRGRNFLAVLLQAGFRRRLHRLVGDLLHAIRVHRVRILLRLGLGDPADTGRLWAVMGPVNALAQWRGADIRIEPDFLEPVLEIQADGEVAVVPLRFLLLAAGFAVSPPTLRAWRTLRGSRA
jgi:hypothetical protein